MDDINQKILAALKENSRQSFRVIGESLFLTGQAVSMRVKQLEDTGYITKYTIREGHIQRHFITAYMKDASFDAFEAKLQTTKEVIEAYKVIGEGCYQLTYETRNPDMLAFFLKQIEPFATYKVLSSVRTVL